MGAGVKVIMVVEDGFLVRLDIAFQLEDEGYEVVAAGTADEALALLLDAHSIDVLFTDVSMPGRIDGLQLAHQVCDIWPP